MSRNSYFFWSAICFILGLIFWLPTKAAEPERWAGTPVFYTAYTPQVVSCVYDKASSQGSCRIKGYPEEGVVGVTTTAPEAPAHAQEMRLYTEVTCVTGICKTQYGEDAGEVLDHHTQYWTIPVGYYLGQVGNKVIAFKHGNGPQAKKYPIRNILEIYMDQKPDGYSIPGTVDSLAFDIHCNTGGDCSYMGKEINYAQLNNYVPKRLTMQCDVRFCYDRNQTIAGLNPRTNNDY